MADETLNIPVSPIKLEITDKKMKAFLMVNEPAADQEISITVQDVLDSMAKEGIVYGINNNLIEDSIAGKKWGERILVAEGTQPIPGEDAKFEFSFPTGKSFRPQITENGHIDYHEISIVSSTEKDSVLVKKISAQYGPAGKDVCGNEVPAVCGKDISLQPGPGTYRDASDSSIIKAAADGIVFYDCNKNSIEVQKLFLIKDSVDFSTGNVHVKSSVEIKGDVKPGFSVTTPYDIQIIGSADQAGISCEGNLKVNKGLVGDGKQHIYAGGDIHAGYIHNQNVRCKGSLYVSTEIRNSNIECGNEIAIVKNTGLILGGKVFATNKLTAATIGNKYNVPTEIEVGIALELKEKHDQKKADMAAVHKSLITYNKKIEELTKLSDFNENNQRIKSLREECNACNSHLDNLGKELKEIEKQGTGIENPTVCVTKTVYPGTIIRIKHAFFEVKEELSRVKFALVLDEVTCTKLN